MAPHSNLSRIDRYWARFFGVEADLLSKSKITVIAHHTPAEFPGAWLFQHGKTQIISVPAGLVNDTKTLGRYFPGDSFLSEATARQLFGDAVDRVVGPVFQGYWEKPVDGETLPLATAANRAALEKFRAESDPAQWRASAIDFENPEIFLMIEAGEIVALSAIEMWSPNAAAVSVITAKNCRRNGFGKRALGAAMKTAFDRGNLVLYQTLSANEGSVALAKKLGFKEYARNMAVHFKG